jgi:hypothetical protein
MISISLTVLSSGYLQHYPPRVHGINDQFVARVETLLGLGLGVAVVEVGDDALCGVRRLDGRINDHRI